MAHDGLRKEPAFVTEVPAECYIAPQNLAGRGALTYTLN